MLIAIDCGKISQIACKREDKIFTFSVNTDQAFKRIKRDFVEKIPIAIDLSENPICIIEEQYLFLPINKITQEIFSGQSITRKRIEEVLKKNLWLTPYEFLIRNRQLWIDIMEDLEISTFSVSPITWKAKFKIKGKREEQKRVAYEIANKYCTCTVEEADAVLMLVYLEDLIKTGKIEEEKK